MSLQTPAVFTRVLRDFSPTFPRKAMIQNMLLNMNLNTKYITEKL